MSKLLLDEPPLQVLPSLALAIGLNEAIVLQQLHYLLRNPKFGKRVAEHQWIFNTLEEWVVTYFPFWSVRSLKRVFTSLAKQKLIITCQPEGRISRRKYYRINVEQLEQISEGAKLASSKGPEWHDGKVPKVSLPITKTSAETSVQRKAKGSFCKEPIAFSSPRFPYPKSEDEMYGLLEQYGIEPTPDYDGNFFENMTRNRWLIRGEPIFDWMQVYCARLEVTAPGVGNRF